MSKITDRIYAASPVWLQQLGINAFGWFWARRRLGPIFERTWRDYVERENWSADRMHDFVEQQLRAQVQRAYREVPFYRQSFRDHDVTERLVESFRMEDLAKLPLLEKSVVRTDSRVLLTERAAKHPPRRFHTSGTTGTPISLYISPTAQQHNLAVREARSFRWAGVSLLEPRATFGGRLVVPRVHADPPFWRFNRWEKQVYFSSYHINDKNTPDYVSALNRYRPTLIEGYSSAIYFLAALILQLELEAHSPKAILTNSERLYSHMRPTIESAFRSPVFEEYGSAENCGLATQCDRGRLHAHPDFGLVEVLRPDGKPAPPLELGELVLTGFSNTDQVFIRYKVGDLGAWSADSCPCGRVTLPVLAELVGREEDTVRLADGRSLTRLDQVFRQSTGILEGQIIQESLNEFVVNVVPSPTYAISDGLAIRERLAARLGPSIRVEIREVHSIPRETNGKFRAVISHIGRTRSS
jgi:phenylacetate-CoA ligase